MPRRIAISTLNASTLDIINTIRANASAEYQSLVPEITSTKEIPKVGEVLYGYPAMANQFLTALINRIALVRVKSATFNNAYANLKKGYLEFGETVEEVFVQIAKAREFSAEKAEAREFKRTIPDVRTALHVMNLRLQYPVTVQDEDLRMAFLSANGVQDLIAKIVDSVLVASEYDEFLLFKYMIIKAVAHGKMYPVAVDPSDIHNSAKAFRGVSNKLLFMSDKYNQAGVHTTTPRNDQAIFMTAEFNAQYDVDVLASAFNMDKATFMGRLYLIDDFTTFDNERFDIVRANCDALEEVTSAELELMQGVIGVLVDKEWFQFYDNQNKMTETYVASGEYWNYFYHVWKTISISPFSNAIVFVGSVLGIADKADFTATITSVSKGNDGTEVFTIVPNETVNTAPSSVHFVQDEDATESGIAVHPYGAYIVPPSMEEKTFKLYARIGTTTYTSETSLTGGVISTGTTIRFIIDA